MAIQAKFRIQSGALLFEMEGDQKFVEQQLDLHRDHIETILNEQVKIIQSGKIPVGSAVKGRRGRPAGSGKPTPRIKSGRKPGRQPVIIRESSLELKPRQLGKLGHYLASIGNGRKLGKDATVFATAYFLCTEVFRKDTFTAGDLSAAIRQLGQKPYLPPADSVDVVQMLRNLAATSIGKEWVDKNADGAFSLTNKGKKVGATGLIVRSRGRRPAAKKRGRPRKMQ
jgi:hypothetical protein